MADFIIVTGAGPSPVDGNHMTKDTRTDPAVSKAAQLVPSAELGHAEEVPAETPKPMVSLDPNGQPTTLSYAVPEPMSYTGRNFITLGLPADAFAVPQIDPAQIRGAATGGKGQDPTSLTVGKQQSPQDALETDASKDGGDSSVSSLKGSVISVSAEALLERMSRFGQYRVSHPANFSGAASVSPDAVGEALQSEDPPYPEHPDPTDGYPDPPNVSISIDTPVDGNPVSGTAQGVTVPLEGRWSAYAYIGDPTISVATEDGTSWPVTFGQGKWTSSATFTTSGRHTVTVTARVAGGLWKRRALTASDSTKRAITVVLTPVDVPPPVLPSLTVTSPFPAQVLGTTNGVLTVAVAGTASVTPDTALGVTITDTTTTSISTSASGHTEVGKPDFTASVNLVGFGAHTLRVVATTPAGVESAPVTIPVTLDSHPPMMRLLNKLMIVETLNLTSYLGSYGAGRCLKTLSLMAGESTTISVKSYRSDTESEKKASSILDSSSEDAVTDFKDSVDSEQTDKDSQTRASEFKVGAQLKASWGFGEASVNASYSGSANSAREEAVKRVSNATRAHSMKASANRSMSVNAESASTLTTTQEDSTIRTISNINVGRTLNYVFREMNQEHIVLYHLTNASVAYYTEDLLLDSNGNPEMNGKGTYNIQQNYQEVSLPELASLLSQILNATLIDPGKVTQAVINALSGIPDYDDTLQTLVEVATPTDSSGSPVPSASYLRVVRNLHTMFQDPYSGFAVQVPGIVLSFDHIVQRTDGVFVDTILGQGDALDGYSHGLQDASVTGKQADSDKAKLAIDLVTTHDDAGAAIYQKVFLPASSEPTSVTPSPAH